MQTEKKEIEEKEAKPLVKESFWQKMKKNEYFSFFVELGKITIISLAIILPVRYFLIQPFYVKGASMEPNFHNSDYLIVNEIDYRLHNPQRGDVIIFRYPLDTKEFFIKRVIGLPGERVLIKDHKIYIFKNGQEYRLQENYLPKWDITNKGADVKLGPNQYFVLGDNREHSFDSRYFGPVDRRLIIGKVWFRGWPFSQAGFIDGHHELKLIKVTNNKSNK